MDDIHGVLLLQYFEYEYGAARGCGVRVVLQGIC